MWRAAAAALRRPALASKAPRGEPLVSRLLAADRLLGVTASLRPTPSTGATALSAWCPLQEPSGPLAPLQVRWAKKSKRKRLPKRGDRTPEQIAASGGRKERIFDRMYDPESSFQMYLTMKNHVKGLVSDGRHNVRRKKDIARYTNYRVMRIAGLTHDRPKEEADRRGFVTPLTKLQDEASLPRSALHRRFNFPHTLNYKVYWGPPSVMEEPNEYEGSMVGCTVALRLHDLPLTQRQKERFVDIVGHDRFDEETGVIALEADSFTERNQNAALLGDQLEKLVREVAAMEAPADLAEPGLAEAAEGERLARGAPPDASRDLAARGVP